MDPKIPDLFSEIIHCKHFMNYFEVNSKNNPCSEIIEHQDVKLIENSFPPEPWMEDLETAEILFVGINPTINKEEFNFPRYKDSEITKFNYLQNRWKQSLKHFNGELGFQISETKWKKAKYWAEIKSALQFLYQINDISPVLDKKLVSLVDVVHCKSQKKTGVKKSLGICSHLYLNRLLALCPAKALLVSGWESNLVFQIMYGCNSMYNELEIAGKRRHVICRFAPGSSYIRDLSKLFKSDSIEIQNVRNDLSTF